jgi:hypothetical protein
MRARGSCARATTACEPTPYPTTRTPARRRWSRCTRSAARPASAGSAHAAAQQGTETLVDDVSFSGAALAMAAGVDEPPPAVCDAGAARAVHISGTPRITIRVAASKAGREPVRLARRAAVDGTAGTRPSVITRGWADPRNHRSLTRASRWCPASSSRSRSTCSRTTRSYPAGRRIGLMIILERPRLHAVARARHRADRRSRRKSTRVPATSRRRRRRRSTHCAAAATKTATASAPSASRTCSTPSASSTASSPPASRGCTTASHTRSITAGRSPSARASSALRRRSRA